MPTTTYLVTGSAGFIGSNLCHHLIKEKDNRVIGIDNLSIGSSILNMPGINKNHFSFLYCNILDQSTLHDVFSVFKPEVVFHLAAETHVDRSITNNYSFWKTNVLGTLTLLECCKIHGIKLFVNQISDEAYGPINKDQIAQEGDVLRPTSPYACSKASQYYVGKSFLNTYDLPIISTFPSNTFGPRQWPEKLIPKFTIRLHRDQKVPLMRSVDNQRDWLTVDDHCRALISLSEKGIIGQDYNVGADNLLSNIEVTRKLLSFTGKDESMIEIVEDRPAHDSRYIIDSREIKNDTGWEPVEIFDDYLKKTVEWYIERADYYPKEL